MEKWKNVVGYEGLYEVSDIGRVKNSRTNHILSPGISQGYYYVALYKDGARKNKQVHRLVAEVFIENKDNYPLINHKDENKKNNVVENIEWCTYLYNNTYNGISSSRSKKLRGRPTWNKGKTMSDSFRQKVSDGMKRRYKEMHDHRTED